MMGIDIKNEIRNAYADPEMQELLKAILLDLIQNDEEFAKRIRNG